jgi:hypothetical protein
MTDAARPRHRRRAKAHRAICLASGKQRYRDGDDASLALRNLRRAAARADLDGAAHTIRVVRKYACDLCGGWHLTSRPGAAPTPARVRAA